MSKKEFTINPASWVPFRDKDVLDKVRSMTREEMENHIQPNPDFKVKIAWDIECLFVIDCFTRIRMSDKLDKKLVMLLPNPMTAAYSNIADLCNKYDVSCRNVHTFCMNEWADQDGNVAPLNYKAGLGYSFKKYFYSRLRDELKPKEDQVHFLTTENVEDYSKMIEETGDGGADICYSYVGWAGQIASINPGNDFKAATIKEYLKLGSRIVTPHPLAIAEDSNMGLFGCSGDIANVPPKAATIGPKDIANSREQFGMHYRTFLGGQCSLQRMISRVALYGPITMDVPASIIRLFKGVCYVSEDISRPIEVYPDQEINFV